jgi:cytochrome P450
VPADRVVDIDIYRLPGSEEDFLGAWLAVAERAPARVVWTQSNGGHWIVLSGAAISHVYADHAHFSSRITLVPRQWGEMYPLRPTTFDPPEHRPYRHILNHLLSAATVQKARPMVKELAARAAQAVCDRGECDFVAEYAAELPFALFARLVGIDPERMRRLPGYAGTLIEAEGSALTAPVMDLFAGFVRELVEERRRAPGDDIISELLACEVDGRPIDTEEAVDLATAVLTGGLDTVVSSLALMIRHLAEDHALRRRLVAEPALLFRAVAEMERRFPIMTKARLVREDQVIDGVVLKAGDMVVMPPLYGLDAACFPDPLRVDIDRAPGPHSTYGNGVHRCPGARLAETEMAIILGEWLARVPEFELDSERPARMQGGVLGTVVTCHLRWMPAADQRR